MPNPGGKATAARAEIGQVCLIHSHSGALKTARIPSLHVYSPAKGGMAITLLTEMSLVLYDGTNVVEQDILRAMATTLTSPNEEGQLAQTIEMFEVITQSQPQDYQSLEILKEAYSKMGREPDVIRTSKRIAQAYVQMGQLSSAILEYETILQRAPDDRDVLQALKEIEGRAHNFPETTPETANLAKKNGGTTRFVRNVPTSSTVPEVDDGRRIIHKLFVDSKVISAADFDLCWPAPDLFRPPTGPVEPFVQVMQDKGFYPVEKSLKLISDRSRAAFLPLQHYDLDMDLARTFPAVTCRRWCVLPIDRMSKSILVATCNPFNQQAAKELAAATPNRLLWYIVTPHELIKNLRKAFR
jgi:tetratricopeptide (TPR) repeat protein